MASTPEKVAATWKQWVAGSIAASRAAEPEKYYATTAINYTNGLPHLGHAYEAIATDVMARYHRIRGRDAHFLVRFPHPSPSCLAQGPLARRGVTVDTAKLTTESRERERGARETGREEGVKEDGCPCNDTWQREVER